MLPYYCHLVFFPITLFHHISGTTLGGSQMYPRLVFHTFEEEPLVRGLQCPNDWMLRGSHRIVFPIRLLYG